MLCVIGLEDIPTCNTAICPYVRMCFIKSFWPMSNTCGGSNYNEHTSRGYLCFPALSGVAFCFFSGMTKKVLIPRVLFLTANNGALPVAGAIMGTCGETVYGDADNQKRSRGKSLVKMVTALFQVEVFSILTSHVHSELFCTLSYTLTSLQVLVAYGMLYL